METIKDKLCRKYCPELAFMPRVTLSLSERGQRYVLRLARAVETGAFTVDGMIIKDGAKCDKLVLAEVDKDQWVETFVELKGSNVGHAIEQLEETIRNPLFEHTSVCRKRACIVARRIPRNTGNSELERAKIRFVKKYRCDLRAVNSGAADRF